MVENNKFYLTLKSVSYYSNYISKIIKSSEQGEKCTLDNYTVSKSDNSYKKMINYSLTHFKFSINTLIPLFVGHQTRK